MALAIDFRSAVVCFSSNLGPPGEAAAIWAALPILFLASGLVEGPTVTISHPGREQTNDTLDASFSITAAGKLSRLFFAIFSLDI